MEIGSATAAAGERSTGYIEVTGLPTGGTERLPVVVARGETDGPTLWVTGGVHGNELTGVAAVQDVLVGGVPNGLRGTVVCVPICSPAALRRSVRTSYYHGDDPNRYFPGDEPTNDGVSSAMDDRRVQELIGERLYERIVESADALFDLHTAQVGSMPFVIRDRVLYDESADTENDSDRETAGETDSDSRRESDSKGKSEARDLATRLAALADATGLPVVTEYPADEYVDRNLDRSAAGAVLNRAGIPALTLELGSASVVEEAHRAAGVAAVYRAMVHLDMLDTVPAEIAREATPTDSPVDFPVRRYRGPNAPRAAICRHRLEAGESFETGDAIADLVSPHGDALETVTVGHDGFVLGRVNTVCYENDPVASLAVRDDDELVVPRE